MVTLFATKDKVADRGCHKFLRVSKGLRCHNRGDAVICADWQFWRRALSLRLRGVAQCASPRLGCWSAYDFYIRVLQRR
jgi:hypothetical protein